MRMIGALFDGALEFGLTRAEVREVALAAVDRAAPDGPFAQAVIDALAAAISQKGEHGEAFCQHVMGRTAPLAREARTALGMEEP